MLLAMTRRLYETITATRQGQWSDNPPLIREFQQSVRRIGGHTVGIVGFGNIGRAFAMRIRGFGPAQIVAYDPFVPQSSADLYGVRLVSPRRIGAHLRLHHHPQLGHEPELSPVQRRRLRADEVHRHPGELLGGGPRAADRPESDRGCSPPCRFPRSRPRSKRIRRPCTDMGASSPRSNRPCLSTGIQGHSYTRCSRVPGEQNVPMARHGGAPAPPRHHAFVSPRRLALADFSRRMHRAKQAGGERH